MNRKKVIKLNKDECRRDDNLIMNIKKKLIPSGMMLKNQIYGVVYHLEKTIKNNIIGDVVELGCNIGTTSVFIRDCLNSLNSNKKFHVYDSWEGLPKKTELDNSLIETHNFKESDCKVRKDQFVNIFKMRNLELL